MARLIVRTLLLALAATCVPSCGSDTATILQAGLGSAQLSALSLSTGTLSPGFTSDNTFYVVGPGLIDSTVVVTPTAAQPGASILVNGVAVSSGTGSDPIALSLGATSFVLIKVTSADAAISLTYSIVFIREGIQSQSAYVKASNTDATDQFGFSVAISGDTIVVGARGEASNATGVGGTQGDDNAGGAGAAYVFTRTLGVWSQQAYLKASNTNATDLFGVSVAISGDTIVVGAYGESSNATGVNAPLSGGSGTQADNSAGASGAAYVFTRTLGVWSQQAYLKASNTEFVDEFGYSVAISGDTIVVGAHGENSNATGVGGNQVDNSAASAGAAYVFTRTLGVWSQQNYLKASNTGASDLFGIVAVSGDTIVVGALHERSNATGVNAPLSGGSGTQADNSAGDAGAAYVYR